jgi:hypothetical protein
LTYLTFSYGQKDKARKNFEQAEAKHENWSKKWEVLKRLQIFLSRILLHCWVVKNDALRCFGPHVHFTDIPNESNSPFNASGARVFSESSDSVY